MKRFVLDANALIRFFRDEDGSSKVASLLDRANTGNAELFISVVNLAEILYVAARTSSLERMLDAIRRIQSLVLCASPGIEDALAAGEIRLRYKLGLADSFAAALAMRMGAALVTADPDFAKLGKKLKILPLPRHHV